jgi:uncharacterized protein (TIGR00251 family)
MGEHGLTIKIKLRAPAVEGKANVELCSFLAEELRIPKRSIALERGQKSRDKPIRIKGLSDEEVRRRLRKVSGADRLISRVKHFINLVVELKNIYLPFVLTFEEHKLPE